MLAANWMEAKATSKRNAAAVEPHTEGGSSSTASEHLGPPGRPSGPTYRAYSVRAQRLRLADQEQKADDLDEFVRVGSTQEVSDYLKVDAYHAPGIIEEGYTFEQFNRVREGETFPQNQRDLRNKHPTLYNEALFARSFCTNARGAWVQDRKNRGIKPIATVSLPPRRWLHTYSDSERLSTSCIPVSEDRSLSTPLPELIENAFIFKRDARLDLRTTLRPSTARRPDRVLCCFDPMDPWPAQPSVAWGRAQEQAREAGILWSALPLGDRRVCVALGSVSTAALNLPDRIRDSSSYWRYIRGYTRDPEVIRIVDEVVGGGVRIPLFPEISIDNAAARLGCSIGVAKPNIISSDKQQTFVEKELEAMLEANCTEVSPPRDVSTTCFSPLFVHENWKKSRLIHDERLPNLAIPAHPFSMETLPRARAKITPGCLMATVDIKTAYYHVLLHSESRRLTGFRFRDTPYRYRVLPFGSAYSPYAFTRVMEALQAFWEAMGVRCIVYIDDILIIAADAGGCRAMTKFVVDSLARAGFVLSAKSVTSPSQSILFLGIEIDSLKMTFRVPVDRWERLGSKVTELWEAMKESSMTANWTCRRIASVAGSLTSMSCAIGPMAALLSRALTDWIREKAPTTGRSWDQPTPIFMMGRTEPLFRGYQTARVASIIGHLLQSNDPSKIGPDWPPEPPSAPIMWERMQLDGSDIALFTDASPEMVGGFIRLSNTKGQTTTKAFSNELSADIRDLMKRSHRVPLNQIRMERDLQQSIPIDYSSTAAELYGLSDALTHFKEDLRGRSVFWFTDSQAACHILVRGSAVSICDELAESIAVKIATGNIGLSVRWIPRARNTMADALTHCISAEASIHMDVFWVIHAWIFKRFEVSLDVDLFASSRNKALPLYVSKDPNDEKAFFYDAFSTRWPTNRAYWAFPAWWGSERKRANVARRVLDDILKHEVFAALLVPDRALSFLRRRPAPQFVRAVVRFRRKRDAWATPNADINIAPQTTTMDIMLWIIDARRSRPPREAEVPVFDLGQLIKTRPLNLVWPGRDPIQKIRETRRRLDKEHWRSLEDTSEVFCPKDALPLFHKNEREEKETWVRFRRALLPIASLRRFKRARRRSRPQRRARGAEANSAP